MDLNIFRKFSENLKKILITAERIAREQNTIMNTEHQLLALLLVKETLAYEILSSFEITADRVQLVASLVSKSISQKAPDGLSEEAKAAIKTAVSIASQYSHYSVDTEHLLLSLLSNKQYNSYAVIERIGANPSDIKKQIETIFGGIKETLQNMSANNETGQIEFGNNAMNEMADFDAFSPMGQFPNLGQTSTKTRSESFLSTFTTNLTKLARNNSLDPVVGREKETERLVQILCRRTKNNPVLIGEPGIGKTAIIEGLAQRINDGHAPAKLVGKEILSIDMGSLLAGTMYRGQFESRVKKLLSEIKRNGNIILFIDEIHTVVGAGSTEGSIDAANLLKPMLARGELHLIGSTTIDEYKKHIEKDPAFERRFQPILVKEPSVKEAVDILKGVKNRYEKYHDVRYTDEALLWAVNLSKRYINDRYLPDKAIDLIDEAAALTNIISPVTARLAKLRRDLRQILRQKEEFIMAERYEQATQLREKEIVLENEIRQLKTEEKGNKAKVITSEDIAKIVSRWTGVPVTELTIQEKKRFLGLEKRIKQQVIGQDEAVLEVVRAIKRSRVGISSPNRPTGSFIFLGPTGVGKTELARVIAEEVLGDRNALIKIDMSEFMERHNVSRLIGAPAGYIGYEEGGKLTESVRRNPYSVILFDEIEKAHPEVFNILLQIMEDGELTDARGRKVDFKNTILVMTSNLGTNFFEKNGTIGFAASNGEDTKYEKLKNDIYEELEEFFKPEFLNRVDKVIIFRPLAKDSIAKIVDIQLKELSKRLREQHLAMIYEPKIRDWIAEIGFDPNFGARPIRKQISDQIETPLAEALLKEEFRSGDTICLGLDKNRLVLNKTKGECDTN